ncbi:MAG: Dna2/Cas4 domain-containing protein [Candidatus Bathyarchaeia archaeon]
MGGRIRARRSSSRAPRSIEAIGEILIPKERKRVRVSLDEDGERELLNALNEIKVIIGLEKPPEPKRIPFCRRCAYRDFCWV